MYDPENTGYIDMKLLASVFESVGLGTLTSVDIAILLKTSDEDDDGRINISDFRHLLYGKKQ